MSDKKKPFVHIEKDRIRYGFYSRYVQEDNGSYSWFIPSFRMFFSSKTKEDGEKRAYAMTQSFFNHWVKTEGFRAFVLELHRLGFKASKHHELTISRLIKHQIDNAMFTPSSALLPKAYENSEAVLHEGNLQIA